tara:strand:+ start:3362 stop:3655 length:294 start_codon:yes stop_codon:yes gene_type:complete
MIYLWLNQDNQVVDVRQIDEFYFTNLIQFLRRTDRGLLAHHFIHARDNYQEDQELEMLIKNQMRLEKLYEEQQTKQKSKTEWPYRCSVDNEDKPNLY